MTISQTEASTPKKTRKKSSTASIRMVRFADPEHDAIFQRYNEMDAQLKTIRDLVRYKKLFEAMNKYEALVREFNEVPSVKSLNTAIAAYIENPPEPEQFLKFLIILSSPQLWFTFAEKNFSNIGAAKQTILNAIMKIEDVNLKYQFLWQALSSNSYIGSLFYVQRWMWEPSLQRGSLNVIVKELQDIVFNQKISFKIDDDILKALQYKGILEEELLKNFSALAFILRNNVNHVELFNHQFPSRMFYSPKNIDRFGNYNKPQRSDNPFVESDTPELPRQSQCDLVRPF